MTYGRAGDGSRCSDSRPASCLLQEAPPQHLLPSGAAPLSAGSTSSQTTDHLAQCSSISSASLMSRRQAAVLSVLTEAAAWRNVRYRGCRAVRRMPVPSCTAFCRERTCPSISFAEQSKRAEDKQVSDPCACLHATGGSCLGGYPLCPCLAAVL